MLGSLLLVIVLLVYSCNGPDGSDADAKNAGATTSAQQGAAAGAGQVEGDATSSPPGSTDDGPQSPSAATVSPTAATDPTFCTDDELKVTPVTPARELKRGATTQIVLKIKNISKRTCKRDVGADLQELYVVEKGTAHKIWSSDECGGRRGTKVESFTPEFERAYTATWNGRESTNCKDRPVPDPGEYQLYGRVGTKRSDPVAITLA